MFKDAGFEVHVACNDDDAIPEIDKKWKVPFVRSPFSSGHSKAFKVLKQIIDSENYTIIHCHTPMASLLTRFASKKARSKGSKVIYTAHGFHFFTGAPLINWLTYYPIELYASKFADGIITINREDFDRIKKRGFQNTKYFMTPGVGVDNARFFPVSFEEKQELRGKLGYKKEDFLVVYAA
jgi:glycosyltransferase EpsD